MHLRIRDVGLFFLCLDLRHQDEIEIYASHEHMRNLQEISGLPVRPIPKGRGIRVRSTRGMLVNKDELYSMLSTTMINDAVERFAERHKLDGPIKKRSATKTKKRARSKGDK